MAAKKGKEYKLIASQIFSTTLSTYYNWDKEHRPIIALLEKYFTKEELEEFLGTGKIEKFENINSVGMVWKRNRKAYLEYFTQNKIESIQRWDEQSSLLLYFTFLHFLKYNYANFNSFHAAMISFSISSSWNLLGEDSTNNYISIKAPSRRLIPFLDYLDQQDGMYMYITSILQEDLKDLLKVEEITTEAQTHIDLFMEFSEIYNRLPNRA